MEFRILGPLEVVVDDRPLALGGSKQRTVLAALLLHANRVVSSDRLIEELWNSRPPQRALNTLQSYVSHLRGVLEPKRAPRASPEMLVTRAPGYLLRVTPDQVDAARFERLFEEGSAALEADDPGVAATKLRAGLALWRGQALAEFTDAVFARGEIARLEELRLVGVETRVAADLALGRHAELVGELEALIGEHPLRERLRGQLMLALYRSGRQADALRVYRDARALLADDLGIEPSADLQRLQEAILLQKPELDWAPLEPARDPTIAGRVPPIEAQPGGHAGTSDQRTVLVGRDAERDQLRQPTLLTAEGRRRGKVPGAGALSGERDDLSQLPPDLVDFTGREAQSAQVRDLLEWQPTAVVISAIAGKGGVGKTTLAIHVAYQVRHRFPDGQLYVNLRGAEAQALEPADVLAEFLRSLGVQPTAIPDGLAERAGLYRARLSDRRILVVLDNAADEAQVRPLLPGSPGCAVLVTSRRRLAGLEGAATVDLDVMEPDQAIELLGKVAGSERVAAEPEAASMLAHLCGYLPLAVRIAGARLAARRHRRLAGYATRLQDERRRLGELRAGDLEVRASFALSYQALSKDEQQMFRLLGLLNGPDFAAWVAAALLDCALEVAEDLVERLVDAQLLEAGGEDATGLIRYRFHDLLRVFARERLREEEPPTIQQGALERVLTTYLVLAERAGARLERV